MQVDDTIATSDHDGIRVDLAQRSFYRLSLLAMQINRAIGSAYITLHGRPANGWKVITVLGRFGPQTASQIRAHTTLEMDKITRIVDSLVEERVASRKQDVEDRRRVIVSLSAKGRKLNDRIEAMIAAMEREFLSELTRSERDALYETLDRLKARGDRMFDTKDHART